MTKNRLILLLFIALFFSGCRKHSKISSVRLFSGVTYDCDFEGKIRRFSVYTPENGITKDSPLVIMLHGYGQSPEAFASYTGFAKSACPEGYTVVFASSVERSPSPEHTGRMPDISWNSGMGTSRKNDSDFLRSLASFMQEEYGCSRKNVFLCGFSNGAFMEHSLALEKDNWFSAMAVVSGLAPIKTWEKHKKNARCSLLQVYGTKDDVIPLRENKSEVILSFPYVEDVSDWWILNNRLHPEVQYALEESSLVSVYASHEKDCILETVRISGGHHEWPQERTTGYDINKVILDFFALCTATD